MTKNLVTAIAVMTLAACTSGPCRQVKNPELANQQASVKAPGAAPVASPSLQGPNAGGSMSAGSGTSNSNSGGNAKQTTVLVYKPDGSLQCGQGKAISPQEMEKQLDGIKVFSRQNRSDGMMHIQVCGSPTGMINVFEISVGSLKDAEKRGFKKFEP